MLNQGFKDDQGEVVVHERTLPQRFQRRFVALLHREKRRLHFDCVGGAAVLKAAVQMLRGLVVMVHPPGCASGQQAGVDVFLGNGRFTSDRTIEVDGRSLHFTRAVIATGGRPTAPQVPGFDSVRYLTNETVFWLTELPKRLLVIGAGPIGCELAQAFARFGSAATIFDVAPRVLPNEDPDASAILHRRLPRPDRHVDASGHQPDRHDAPKNLFHAKNPSRAFAAPTFQVLLTRGQNKKALANQGFKAVPPRGIEPLS